MATVNLVYTLGMLEVGAIISAFLFGITTIQAYTYYSDFSDDRWQLKTLVITVWSLELILFISFTHFFYIISILQNGRADFFGPFPASLSTAIFIAGIIVCIVQAFFTERARKFLGKPYLAILCWFLLLLRILLNLGFLVLMCRTTEANVVANFDWLNLASWSIGTTMDVLITVLLCYEFVKTRKHALLSTTRLLDRLIIITIPTGICTSLVSIIITICFVTMPHTLVWFAIYICQSRMYSISLLVSLNSRKGTRQMIAAHNGCIIGFAQTSPKSILPEAIPPIAISVNMNMDDYPNHGLGSQVSEIGENEANAPKTEGGSGIYDSGPSSGVA